MAYTKEEKKKQILNYLEKNTKQNSWFSLSKREIFKNFCDKEFNEHDIRDILKELRKDQRTDKCEISFDIRYPVSHSERVKSILKGYVEPPKIIYFGLGLYILLAFASSYPPFFIFLKNNSIAESAQDFFIVGVLVGIFGSYSIGWLLNKIYDYLDSKIPLLHQNKDFIMPFIIIGITSVGIILLYSIFTKKSLEIAHIIALITVILVGGFGYLNWKKKTRKYKSKK